MTQPLFPDVTVNGVRIPHSAIAAEAQHHTAPAGKPGLAWRKAAQAMVIRTLLMHEAGKRGIAPAPVPSTADRYETEEEALMRDVLDDALDVSRPTPQQVRAAFDADPAKFAGQPFEAVRDRLALAVEQADWARAARAFVSDMIAGAEIRGVDMRPA